MTINNISANIQNALAELGYKNLTEIQESVFETIINNNDIMAQAPTGSGKTAAFVIPIVEKILKQSERKLHTVILSPTRELALQTDSSISRICKYTDIKHIALYGGTNKEKQLERLNGHIDIISATPGRLIDLLVNDDLDLSCVETIVIDEADRMLDIEMKGNILNVVSFLHEKHQTLFFSATYPLETSLFAKKLLKKPSFFSTKENLYTPKNITFDTIKVEKSEKINALLKLLTEKDNGRDNQKCIIFTNTIHCTNFLYKLLICRDILCINLHSQRSQHQREEAIKKFSEETNIVMICTDIAARGIDIPNVDLVINYDKAKDNETHIHRSGRTGRMEKKGHVISFN